MYVIKKNGRREKFSGRKLFNSCFGACLVVRMDEKKARQVSNKIVKQINQRLKNKREVHSSQIFNLVKVILKKYSKEAAFMYETHRDIS